MIGYSYHPVTKEYLGEIELREDPLDGGYLVPAMAATEAPPEPQEGKAIVFDGEAWDFVSDYRGKVYYDFRNPVTINELGEIPDGLTETPAPLTTEEITAQKDANIQAAMIAEADPLFFQWQAGEIEKQVWLDKRQEIKDRFQ